MILQWVKENIGYKAAAFAMVVIAIAVTWGIHYNSYEGQLARLQQANITNLGCYAHKGAVIESLLEGRKATHPTAMPVREVTIDKIWNLKRIEPEVPLEVITPEKPKQTVVFLSTARALYKEAVAKAMNRQAIKKRILRSQRLECVGRAKTSEGDGFRIRFIVEQNKNGSNDVSFALEAG